MKKIIKKADSRKGFTLVELICVIAIIVIIGAVVAFNYFKIVKELPWKELVGENPFSITTKQQKIRQPIHPNPPSLKEPPKYPGALKFAN